jgi:hypothetical protein
MAHLATPVNSCGSQNLSKSQLQHMLRGKCAQQTAQAQDISPQQHMVPVSLTMLEAISNAMLGLLCCAVWCRLSPHETEGVCDSAIMRKVLLQCLTSQLHRVR